MRKRLLRILSGLTCSVMLLSVSWIATATIIDPFTKVKDTKLLFEALLETTDYYSPFQSDALSVQTEEQARQALQILKQRLRQMGDIAAISLFSPRIIELLPADQTIRYLYAIALAAKGDVATATGFISNLEPIDEETRLYASLAEAAISKATGQHREAVSSARRAIALDSGHPFAYNLLGQIRVAQGNNQEAINNFRAAVEYAPQFAAAHSNLGAVQFLQGDHANAWQSFTQSVELSPGFCPPLIGRAVISSGLGDTANAIDDLETCVSGNPPQLLARKKLTGLYLQTGQLDNAVKLADAAILMDPVFTRMTLAEVHLRRNESAAAREQLNSLETLNAQARYLLSFSDAFDGKLENALNSVKQGERLQPDSATLRIAAVIYSFYDRKPVDEEGLEALIQDPGIGALAAFVAGNVHASQNNFEQAYRYWLQADDLLPGFILKGLTPSQIQDASAAAEQRYLSLGMLYYLKSYYSAALSEFDKAIAISPDSFMANFFSALALAQAGDSNEVTEYLLRSIKKAPGFFPANYMLAEHYLRQRDVNNALKYYNTAADSEPDQGVLVKLGLLYEGQGDTEAAEKIYQRFINSHSASFLGYNQLAWLYAKQGRKLDEAMQLARTADELRPENSSVNDTIGWIYFQKNDYDQADRYLQKANAISKGRNPDILFHLAAVQYKKGNPQAAKAHLEQALATSDSFESINDARQLLSTIEASGS